jgi:predicted small secreted protein
MKFPKLSLVSKLAIVGVAGLMISACSSTMEGVGKDLQNLGTSMGGSSNTTQTPQNNQSQTKGKDVVITPVK